jgi:hypothetical protein
VIHIEQEAAERGQALWFVVEQHPIFLQEATKGTEQFRAARICGAAD